MRHIAVIDIGKTNAKLLSVDLATGQESTVARRPNEVRRDGLYPHFDTDALWQFVLDGLAQMAAAGPVDAISVTTHGACAALVDAEGALAMPVLDYEHAGPDEIAADYQAVRPAFGATGSPRLPMGLNLGAQLYWQQRSFPDDFARTRYILMYPQYWSFRLCGVAASESTSLGCHTDLWNPWAAGFSSLVERMGWAGLFPPVRPASAVLGAVLPEVAAATGLHSGTPMICGIHDSNASLMPHLGRAEQSFAVMSTGTWMISLAIGGVRGALAAERDVLVNVNAHGQPTPTARYMAGREFDEITQSRIVTPTAQDEAEVLRQRIMAMPSLHTDTGPFPGLAFAWHPDAPGSDAARTAAASFYAALMGAECLSLIGAMGPVIVEGPFGGNRAFLRMLATATGRPVLAVGPGAGTGLGAALLAGPLLAERPGVAPVLPEPSDLWLGYAREWRAEVARRWSARQGM